ncbi:hypothetical protein M231_01239 [Tremella mesenterica]|uniref:Fcf2 pre-rRNA processing C-terminal domain-containing protein n=1 Tax=Tremella mesenterica TaxID=5217 RepID=A0A4Q1BTW8_TREME|nr:hypothetical protein M231_01239 [Tremella mesenterica]
MPTTRRQSHPLTPTNPKSIRKTRSTSHRVTPTNLTTPTTHGHHRSADKLAAEEAARILSTPLEKLSHSDNVLEGSSGRDERHRHLIAVREVGALVLEPESAVEENLDEGQQEGRRDENFVALQVSGENERIDVSEGQVNVDSSESEGIETSSESESDSDSDISSDDTSNSEQEEEDQLEILLQKAKLSAMQKYPANVQTQERDPNSETVLRFEEEDLERPIPGVAITNLPKPYITFRKDGSAHAINPSPVAGPSKGDRHYNGETGRKGVRAKLELELDNRPYERELSKREKAAQPRKATPSELWATLPAPRMELLPQMKRDYQALALANSLDPKRFMKGSTKLTKVPDTFMIGTMIDTPRHVQDTTMLREKKYRPGEIVRGLVEDQETGQYAKRKYEDLQGSRMYNGRGKGWKKRTKW